MMQLTQRRSLKLYCVRTFIVLRVKSAEHQARGVIFRTHQCLVRQRTQLINALRGHLAEFGLIFPQGPTHLKQAATVLEDGTTEVPDTVSSSG